ncbi:ATP-dependent Clp protease ATP-binding subunit [Treponema parvum]|uniref:ATP-dependent Clp protease ATP-binding subunit n=1 Tax=Treponema parvum TaxID=138851 RepID=A0A975IDD0_9SPIR|nr:ATP-dependent Clp protease ATP-binding subunit [Treponema parvum]QTQ12029.1 ATP-dependent Clp protease ATP-binding subunit [Treponema parvum]
MKQFSPRAHRLIASLAQDEGRKSGSDYLYPEHVLLALLKSGDGLGFILLQTLHINILTYQLTLEQSLTVRTPVNSFGDLPLSRRFNNMLDVASAESGSLRNEYIGTEHIVIAAIREDLSITSHFFQKAGVNLDDVINTLRDIQARIPSSGSPKSAKSLAASVFQSLMGEGNAKRPEVISSSPTQGRSQSAQNAQKSFLAEFSRDLTANAVEGKTDPVVGRDIEILRVIQILSRRTKNNPVLIGEPGVGKTAIVEGLAQRIAEGSVPKNLLKKRILSLDLAAMIAGTKYRGEFEERMKRMMKEINDSKNIILFVDELHTIIGAGGPEGTLDASNMIKPALSRGELQIIGATTIKEYRKYVEKDSALERRFQIVRIEEPSDTDTAKILEGIRKKYEDFHGVVYDEGVIPAIVKFAHRYIPERFLPDKAIDILDEAGAAKKIQEDDRPSELVELEKNIEELGEEKRRLVREQDYEKAALIRDKVKALKERLEIFSRYWRENGQTLKHITEQDVCKIISNMTGIPAAQLDNSEARRLLTMEKEIHKEVIGQDEAINLISSAVRRNRAGVSSVKRPIGSFIFLGPTGVGKTQLAKTLAKFLFGTDDSLIRIDMSDYMEKHNASRLVGAPPGYIGYDEGGILTEQVRRRPYSVILLDEIEKAHPDIFNLLLQLLEEGELSDNLGHTVNFRNTVIIMTSNAGAREITGESHVGFSASKEKFMPYNEIRAGAIAELKKIMSPELLNRIDDVVVFNALNREQVSSILNIQLLELEERLEEKGFSLALSTKARSYLVDNGYDPSMGARPMRRLIQREIEDALSIIILSGEGETGDTVFVDKGKDSLTVKFRKKRKANHPATAEKPLIEAAR